MVEPTNETLVNGKPAEDDDDETTGSQSGDGSGDVHGSGDTPDPNGEAGAGSPDDQAGQKGTLEPPGSPGEIRQGISTRFERLKREGPEPIRQAAKGLVDRAFDAVDRGFELWFGRKK